MKRILPMLFFLSLCLLLFGCSREQPEAPDTSAASPLRYQGQTAYYTLEGGDCTMGLSFAEPVEAGSHVVLLQEDGEVLSFTAEASFSRLRLSTPELKRGQSYTLKVNGLLQKHGQRLASLREDAIQPGDIPEPEVPSVPQEPKEQGNGSLSNIELPSLSVAPGLALSSDPEERIEKTEKPDSLEIRPPVRPESKVFSLDGEVTEFTFVQNAS